MTETNVAPDQSGATPMSGAELRCLREWLGLTTRWLADRLGVAERSVHRWESGDSPIPRGVADGVLALSEQTYEILNGLIEQLLDTVDPVVITYRTDADYQAHHPEGDWPASWHRALCARIADEVPGLRITYWHAS